MAKKLIDYNKMLDSIESSDDLQAETLTKTVMTTDGLSTGSLSLDLFLGGGLIAGKWYQFSGKPGSAKSTAVYEILKSAYKAKVPIKTLYDYEGTTDSTYITGIYQKDSEKVFNKKEENGIRYYKPTTAEEFFNTTRKLIKSLPDIVKIDGVYYNKYPRQKPWITELKGLYNEKLYKERKAYYVPMEGSPIKAVITVDSLQAMVPEKLDEQEEASNDLGQNARMFSKQIPRIKTFTKKGIILVFVSQIREKPMVMFGSPIYEPGGNSLQFFSDCRTMMAAIGGKAGMEEETNVFNEEIDDLYQYIRVTPIKNKISSRILNSIKLRIWTRDHNGVGRGFDPFFDTQQYLQMTGQLEGRKGKCDVNVDGYGKFTCDFFTLKKLILFEEYKKDSKKELESLYKTLKLKKTTKDKSLRQILFKQINSGKAVKMIVSKDWGK